MLLAKLSSRWSHVTGGRQGPVAAGLPSAPAEAWSTWRRHLAAALDDYGRRSLSAVRFDVGEHRVAPLMCARRGAGSA
jgi:hypothetical protein